MKITHTYITYDPDDCVSRGHRLDVYSDGHVAITYRSNWVGARTGERWISKPDQMESNPTEDDMDEELEQFLSDYPYSNWYRCTNKGSLIR